MVQAYPGAGKTLLLVTDAKLMGVINVLCLTFNANMAEDARKRGAINSFTFNALGMRALRIKVLANLKLKRSRGMYTGEQERIKHTSTQINQTDVCIGRTSLHTCTGEWQDHLDAAQRQQAWGPAVNDVPGRC